MPRTDLEATLPDPVILTIGRLNLDLYVEEPGRPIRDATTYRASVGGSPANIAIVARRLGIPSAVLSATGKDHSGEFVRAELSRFGVDTRFLVESVEGATSLALLATIEPDVGERQFYRSDPADTHVGSDIVESLPWGSLRSILVSADALARGPMAETAVEVARRAIERDITVWWDLDLRPSSWPQPRQYHNTVPASVDGRSAVIGTEEEFAAFLGVDRFTPSSFADALAEHQLGTVVLKRGPKGAILFLDGEQAVDVPARTTTPACTVGGGDAAAGALVAARVAGQPWQQALELAMESAARTVEQPYCSSGFPTPANLGIQPLAPAVQAGAR